MHMHMHMHMHTYYIYDTAYMQDLVGFVQHEAAAVGMVSDLYVTTYL